MAKHGWNVVVRNHRGLGGVAITSDCFYSGGWTEDARKVLDHLHCQYPDAPLFVVGTSIGANILVKYLGEDGINVPIVGAAAIFGLFSYFFQICDRFMARRLVQRFYNKAMTIGLKNYAYVHKALLSRLSNWEGVRKSRWIREFGDCATRILGNFEVLNLDCGYILDTYYRRCSSANFVGSVMVPLICVSSLDDPICSSEAIPGDECRCIISFLQSVEGMKVVLKLEEEIQNLHRNWEAQYTHSAMLSVEDQQKERTFQKFLTMVSIL
ncbi:hypothetical protein ACJIZ3_013856 [Penstemon smallii]|uniref:Serine aminopeptidase S33 domain-containing protein n=1 Tax=Penstemon smallii TaxID=265156 RepID=A0ABD3RI86_9LAMI